MMQKDIRLHGQLPNGVEYFVLVVGTEAYQRYFFNIVQEKGELRIFSPGNEFVIARDGIRYEGNGGYFCEYMFGVEQPATDLAKPEIVNRLVMYGATTDGLNVTFSDQTVGSDSYENIFMDGNAVCNYFFFVHSKRMPRHLKEQQEELVRLLGKALKRSPHVGDERDDLLVSELYPLLQDREAQLFIVKLVDARHKAYRDLFKDLYFRSKKIADDDFDRLVKLAAENSIDRYQQERMRIDVMYRHPLNRRIVDEYCSILISCNARGEITALDNARLNRLKSLSVRNKIPGALFHTLESLLKTGRALKMPDEEGSHIDVTRQIIEGFFLHEEDIENFVDRDDMLALLRAKKHASVTRDSEFDRLMLDFSRKCDELIRDGAAHSMLTGFSYIVTYLDRFDSTMSLISQLAFMENVRINEDILRLLMEHKAAFDNLSDGCFEELFLVDLFNNPYLGRFGRLKMTTLLAGIEKISSDNMTLRQLHSSLAEIDAEERGYIILLGLVRHRVKNFYSSFATKADQDALKREVLEEIRSRKLLDAELPEKLFEQVIHAIQTEAVYLHNILPEILSGNNTALREDFLANSGLDRFYVEELEREYMDDNGMLQEGLCQVRTGLA